MIQRHINRDFTHVCLVSMETWKQRQQIPSLNILALRDQYLSKHRRKDQRSCVFWRPSMCIRDILLNRKVTVNRIPRLVNHKNVLTIFYVAQLCLFRYIQCASIIRKSSWVAHNYGTRVTNLSSQDSVATLNWFFSFSVIIYYRLCVCEYIEHISRSVRA